MRYLVILLVFLASPLWAVDPKEMLGDPILEERARALSQELRCPVCRNESIDESNATLAQELRIVLRERLVAGDSDQDVLDYLVARYGEFVLLKPVFSMANAALWIAGPLLFLLGLIVSIFYVRSRKPAQPEALSAEEQAEMDRILKG